MNTRDNENRNTRTSAAQISEGQSSNHPNQLNSEGIIMTPNQTTKRTPVAMKKMATPKETNSGKKSELVKMKTTPKKKPEAKQKNLPIAPEPTPSNLVMMPLSLIITQKQIRTKFEDESLMELAADIASRGVLQPILLRPLPGSKKTVIIFGERRYRAAKLAGLDTIPAIVGEIDDDGAKGMQIAENIQREDLNLEDTAKAVRDLYELTNKSVTETAAKLHKSKAWVSKHLAASCENLHWIAKGILENGIAEDLEIIITLDKLAKLNFAKATEMSQALKEGKAGRQTVREAYEVAKKAADELEAQREKQSTPEEQAAAKAARLKEEDKWKQQQDEKESAKQRDPKNICREITWNAETAHEDRNELTKEQRKILGDHLKTLYTEGSEANPDRALKKLTMMVHSGDYAEIEIAAYFSGTTEVVFNPENLIKQVTESIVGIAAK